ncbi:hypothetical protein, partial [Faecalibacterium prausnitzii]|uniref:hypothetical protein n=1 Tax=Faecalibacterium prausnitzii TaxID=853 RepID=UPI003F1B5C5D
LSSSFFEVFRDSDFSGELGAFSVSRRWPELSDVYWFFSLYFQPGLGSHSFVSALGAWRLALGAWRLALGAWRLALKYNTIRRATLQAFFTSFLLFFRFCIHPPVFHLKSVPALTPVQHACGVLPLQVGGGVALYIIRRASAAFTGQTDALLYMIVTSGHTPA